MKRGELLIDAEGNAGLVPQGGAMKMGVGAETIYQPSCERQAANKWFYIIIVHL